MNMSTLITDRKLFKTTLTAGSAVLILVLSGCESTGNLLPEASNGGKVTVVNNNTATICSSENNELVVGTTYEVYRRETVRNRSAHAAQKTSFKDTAVANVRIESAEAKCATAAIVSGSLIINDFVKLD
jgi:hypothetical protein